MQGEVEHAGVKGKVEHTRKGRIYRGGGGGLEHARGGRMCKHKESRQVC